MLDGPGQSVGCRSRWTTSTPPTGSQVDAGLQIVHPLSDEEWGVRRFFFADPSGNVVNVLSHLPGSVTADG